jgi:hypothetical protein
LSLTTIAGTGRNITVLLAKVQVVFSLEGRGCSYEYTKEGRKERVKTRRVSSVTTNTGYTGYKICKDQGISTTKVDCGAPKSDRFPRAIIQYFLYFLYFLNGGL